MIFQFYNGVKVISFQYKPFSEFWILVFPQTSDTQYSW